MNEDNNQPFWREYAEDFLFIEDQPGIIGVQRFCGKYYQRHPDKHFLIVGNLKQLDVLYNPADSEYDAVIFNPEARKKPGW